MTSQNSGDFPGGAPPFSLYTCDGFLDPSKLALWVHVGIVVATIIDGIVYFAPVLRIQGLGRDLHALALPKCRMRLRYLMLSVEIKPGLDRLPALAGTRNAKNDK